MARSKDSYKSVSDGFDFSSEDIEEVILEQAPTEPNPSSTNITEKKNNTKLTNISNLYT